MSKKRAVADILILLSVFIFPWWVTFIVATICLFIFKNFYEIFVFGILIDILYGIPIRRLPIPVFYTLLATIEYIVVAPLYLKLKFN
ncbi:MAG: hypothetical protein EXS46_02365 [Candidatus Taylorbacteria bacterium]|nr:hypothetical protein [Candidatus Taylorbacteria bacterium]